MYDNAAEIERARKVFESVPKGRVWYKTEEFAPVMAWVDCRIGYEKENGVGSFDQQLEWFSFLRDVAASQKVSQKKTYWYQSLLLHAILSWAGQTENHFGKSYLAGFDEGKLSSRLSTIDGIKHQNELLAKTRGKLGAKAKHRRAAELKAWTEQQAKAMKGADLDIARRLAAQIPEHLTGASKNPERLIYEHLRARRNTAS